MSATKIAEPKKERNLFDGGYRVVSTIEIEAITAAAIGDKPLLDTRDLRVYCALIERWHGLEQPNTAELKHVLMKKDRLCDIEKSLARIEQVLASVTTEPSIKALIPRRALRYGSGQAGKMEILLILKAGVLALHKQGYQFRIMATSLCQELKSDRKTLTRALVQLREKCILKDTDPMKMGANHPRTVQRYGLRLGWSCYQVVATKRPTPQPQNAPGYATKRPSTDTKIYLRKSSYNNPNVTASKAVNQLVRNLCQTMRS